MSPQYGELRPTSGWDRSCSLRHPCKFQWVSHLGSVTARHLVVGVSQTLRHWTEGATCVRQSDHHVGYCLAHILVGVSLVRVTTKNSYFVWGSRSAHAQGDLLRRGVGLWKFLILAKPVSAIPAIAVSAICLTQQTASWHSNNMEMLWYCCMFLQNWNVPQGYVFVYRRTCACSCCEYTVLMALCPVWPQEFGYTLY